ncbi:bifunctional DNA primase/polymerase [Calidifontibacter terrae]
MSKSIGHNEIHPLTAGEVGDQPGTAEGLAWAAMTYASAGMAVFPAARATQCRKAPHAMLGDGFSYRRDDARPFVGSTDPQQVASWWAQDKWANIGVPTGVANNLLVVDCDRHRVGQDGPGEFAEWADVKGVDLSTVPRVRTPTDGLHYWFRLRERQRSMNWLPGVEIKADGVLVLAPPSLWRVRLSLRRAFSDPPNDPPVEIWRSYQIEAGDLSDLPDVPDALLTAVRSFQVEPSIGERNDVETPPFEWWLERGFGHWSGSRNRDCLAFARSVLNRTSDETAVYDLTRQVWAVTRQQPHPFSWREAQKCIRQAVSYWEAEDWGWRG